MAQSSRNETTLEDQQHAVNPARRMLGALGPGLITGASDDDPSGIGTYSHAGAQFGFGIGWTMLLTYPLMAAIQEISARIGRTTGHGIAGNLRRHYPNWLLYTVVTLLFTANTINIAADLSAMADAVRLLIGGPATLYVVLLGTICVTAIVFMTYERYVWLLKWLTLSLFAYVAALFAIKIPWDEALFGALVPRIIWTNAYFTTLLAIFGTTISPYLFFWQASLEAEDQRVNPLERPLVRAPHQAPKAFERIRADTLIGMGFSIGIIGTGLLAVPVLAGSAAYAVGEACRWPVGLARKPSKAAAFYGALAVSTILGMAITLTPLDPIKALYWSAVINGVVAVPVMTVMMLMTMRRNILGKFAILGWLRWLGWASTAVMAACVAAMVIGWFA